MEMFEVVPGTFVDVCAVVMVRRVVDGDPGLSQVYLRDGLALSVAEPSESIARRLQQHAQRACADAARRRADDAMRAFLDFMRQPHLAPLLRTVGIDVGEPQPTPDN